MTQKQLDSIKRFAKPFYNQTGKFHDWSHIRAVRKHCLWLVKQCGSVDKKILESACYLHDIGRSKKDEGHGEKSVMLATPFLKKIGLSTEEVKSINHVIACHEVEKIGRAKTVEARLFFDADKLEILSVSGFIRVICFLMEERKMKLGRAINFLWEYVSTVRKKYIFSKQVKELVDEQLPTIKQMVEKYNQWQQLLY
jgi:HD superfamily phosphodiesterase